MSPRTLSFRTGDVLATAFTGTVTERYGTPVERIPTPSRLMAWCEVSGFEVGACTAAQLEQAQELREAIHAVATAAASRAPFPAAGVQLINSFSAAGRAAPRLTLDGHSQWQLGADSLTDALGVIAADAIALVSGGRDGRLALCASETCRAVFLDASRSGIRRWCDMNYCGNRQKKDRFKAKRLAGGSVS